MTEALVMAKRPGLLVLTSTYPRWAGDPEPGFVHELARRLIDRFDVCVIGPHASGALAQEELDGVLVHRYRYAPVRLETLVNNGGMLGNVKRAPWKWLLIPGFLLGQYCALRKAIRRFQPQVVHVHWMLPQGLVAAIALRNVPWIVTSHGADLFGLRGRWFARLRGWVTGHASMMTVVSEAMRVRLLSESPGLGVAVLPMGVDTTTRFTPGVIRRNDGEMLFVGRLVEKKGVHHLLHAMPAVLAKHPQATLTIVGFGPELNPLQELVQRLSLQKHVNFVGALSQDELAQYYQRASLFVAPFIEASGGDQEGLGLVVAEAMACGCPVVVGDVPAVRDLVDAETGVRVVAADHAALAEAIVILLDDGKERARLSAAGRRYVEQHYSWDVVSDRYAELLHSVAGAPKP
ncbi:glycosyltransferase family 4 protein [Dyella sp. 20L07]|uniref:glycosyltransferase family 4 protein n=1 Tax=Dyella sp. 20L07 TaxID=3384240 RepID=UPI003D2D4DAD